MNKSELIEALSTRFASKAEAARALEAVLGTISQSVASGDRVVVTGFGTFERVHRPSRRVRNPSSGATMMSADTHVVRFRPGGVLREQVAGASPVAPTVVTAPAPAAESKKPKAKKDDKASKPKDAKKSDKKKSKKDDKKKSKK